MRRLRALLLGSAILLAAGPGMAVQPDEVLEDAVLEDRARDISAGLRCPVCQNESIDESSAEIARDLRLLVRERLVEGDNDAEVVDYIVARYGEYVLLTPNFVGANRVGWVLPLILLLAGVGLSVAYVRGRASAVGPGEAGLSADEQARLDAIMQDGRGD